MKLFSKRLIGERYEKQAKRHLLGRGLQFVAQNFNTKFGELDLIMRDGSCLVFVEVKYRKLVNYGHAAEFVDRKKRARLIKTAHIWLSRQRLSANSTEFRFDVVAVHDNGRDINWIKNAITEG